MAIASKRPSGPEAFALALSFVSYLTEETIRPKLGNLRLKDILGEHVRTHWNESPNFPEKLIVLEDLQVTCYNCVPVHSRKEHRLQVPQRRIVIVSLQRDSCIKYQQELVQSNDWPPAKRGNKEGTDSQVQGLIAKMNEVSNKVDAKVNQLAPSGGQNSGVRHKGEKLHGRKIPPNFSDNEAKQKTVDDVVFKHGVTM
eukprot:scaffold91_cov127-Cylindrotheca_fusiformis.AAC.16